MPGVETDDALLVAALEQFALVGIRRTSADDIARRAGVNRATLYRRLGTKSEIVAAALLHETSSVLAQIEATIGDVPEPGTDAPDFDAVEYVVTFFVTTLTAVRDNQLLQRLLEVDRDETLVGLTFGAGPALTLSAGLVADRVRALRVHRAGAAPSDELPDDVAALAITLARLTQSLLLTPDAGPSLDNPARMRQYAEQVVVPMVLRV
ncbi:unannotated protein [freshwater metagenome]|uniref:Unannotated protein n=1 Tax=freshwater metagenome TaxID=449393 RepID=A0A6J6P998_9ZZZZ